MRALRRVLTAQEGAGGAAGGKLKKNVLVLLFRGPTLYRPARQRYNARR